MSQFIADFHIHSRFSLATSKYLTPTNLDYWARIKGLSVIGTGDFTHPTWTKELYRSIEESSQGLYTLKKKYRDSTRLFSKEYVQFMLTAEISTIYKKYGRTRKVHTILWSPSIEIAEKLQAEFAKRNYNITSDGRPIIGLDARDLVALCKDVSEDIHAIPAHIWTPWFSALGAKSGFNSIQECYADMEAHIFAVETGLSSDAPMNLMCSFLDSYALLSNSDAHSPDKLGRNANIFNCERSYNAIVKALRNKDSGEFIGTFDTFPQTGKYYSSGHRKCNKQVNPVEVLEHNFACTKCNKSYTLGVMDRVMQLADRSFSDKASLRHSTTYIVPLAELIAHVCNMGEKSKKVQIIYGQAIEHIGNEFYVLTKAPIQDIATHCGQAVATAIERVRNMQIIIHEGFDGQYGTIEIFSAEELQAIAADAEYVPSPQEVAKYIRFNFDTDAFIERAKNIDFSAIYGNKPDGQLSLFL